MLNKVETESENWNFLKYGRIGNTLCNPYIQGTTVPCDIHVCVMSVCSISADNHVQMKFTGTETCRDFPSHVIIDMDCGLHGLSLSR